MTGDQDNPLYQGFSCIKGRSSPQLHNSPDRLLHALKRQPDGSFERIAVEQAMDEIALVLRRMLDEHGPRSVAGYFGSGVITSAPTMPAGFGFFDAIGSPMRFDAGTIDQPGKNTAKGCHGEWMASSSGSIDPDVVMFVGVNPTVSNVGVPVGNPGGWLTAQLRRGMELIVIDPRRTDAARRATLFIQPLPGHDAAIFAAIARVIIDEGLYDREFVADNVAGLEDFRRVLEPFAPAEVAAAADVDADDLVRAARMFAAARRAYIRCGTGPSMSGSTTLIEYLRMNVDTLCGHWQREGDLVPNAGVTIPAVKAIAQAKPPYPSYGDGLGGEPVRVRGLRATTANMPTAALADEILLPGEGQVRALLQIGGNPVVAWPDQHRTIEAFESLELLVTIDMTMTPTARMSHYVFAPKMHLEYPGITWISEWLSQVAPGSVARTYGQYTPAIAKMPEGSELIEDWELFYGLANRLGVTLAFHGMGPGGQPYEVDMDHKPTMDDLLEVYMSGARVPIEELKAHPHGAFFSDDEVRVAAKEPGWEGRLDLANDDMMRDLGEIGEALAAFSADGDYPFRLISRRMRHVYNSAANHPATHRGRPYNPAFMHPVDLDRLGMQAGDIAEISSPYGTILGVVETDDSVRPGLVSMSHAYGSTPEDDAKVRAIGGPTARLSSVEDDYDRYTGQPRMSNIPVRVTRSTQAVEVPVEESVAG